MTDQTTKGAPIDRERTEFILSKILCSNQSTLEKILAHKRFLQEDPFDIRRHGNLEHSATIPLYDIDLERLRAFMQFYSYQLVDKSQIEHLFQHESLLIESLVADYQRRRHIRWQTIMTALALLVAVAALVIVVIVLNKISSPNPTIDENLRLLGQAHCLGLEGIIAECDTLKERDCRCCFNASTETKLFTISCE